VEKFRRKKENTRESIKNKIVEKITHYCTIYHMQQRCAGKQASTSSFVLFNAGKKQEKQVNKLLG